MIRQGTWCDLARRPKDVAFVRTLRNGEVTCETAEPAPLTIWRRVVPGGELLYLSAAADGTGRVGVIGKSQTDGHARLLIDGEHLIDLGETAAIFGTLLVGHVDGFTAYVLRTSTSYDEIRLTRNGDRLSTTPRTILELSGGAQETTSQGFLQVLNGRPVLQDGPARIQRGLSLPSRAGSVWAGQSRTSATIALYDETTGQITPLGTRGGQPPHILDALDGSYYVCSWIEDGPWWERVRRPFAAVPPPPIDPPVDPPEEPDVSVRDVPNLIHVIARCVRDFPDAWKNCHKAHLPRELSEEFARRAGYACSLEDPRFGLNGKRGDPNDLSDDCVCFKHDDGRESVIDFGGGAGGDNPTVQWSIVGHYMPPGPPLQLWIKAEPVGGTPNPPPPPPPPAGRPFPAFRWPEDVFLHMLTRYINEGLYERDKPVENPEGTRTASRGALMWFVPIVTEKAVGLISAKGNQLPSPEEWWRLANEGADAAIAFYRRTAPPE